MPFFEVHPAGRQNVYKYREEDIGLKKSKYQEKNKGLKLPIATSSIRRLYIFANYYRL